MTDSVVAGGPAVRQRRFLRAMGKRIRLVRVDRELSQAELAVAAGMSRNFVSSVERGAHGVDVVWLAFMARALEVGIGDLLPSHGLLDGVSDRSSR